MDKAKIIDILNKILECELAGVVRYTHYSLMIFGHTRIPIVKWLREQASESLGHANQAGEHITTLGGHPSLKIAALLETHKHAINDILTESLEHERQQLGNYAALLKMVEGHSVFLEEYARRMIHDEETHISEVEKMIRKPE
ncbi:MAG: ferritin-like domain-containing protein [Alphaproteobacteria bacterium]